MNEMFSRELARHAAARAAAELSCDPRVRLVMLFGSIVDDSRQWVRDIDLAVLRDQPMSLDDRLRLQADLGTAVGMTIDIVPLEQAGVVLAHEVADSGVCLYSRTPDDEIEFVTRARSRYWDFKPYLEQQWKLLGERLEQRRDGTAR